MNPTGLDRNLRVLFVCTANVCRSPLAAALLKLRASQAGAPISVASAGTLAEGMSADKHVVSVLGDYGVDASAKKSRLLAPELIRASDIVLAMTMTHARRVIGEASDARERVFLLRELVQLASIVGPRPEGMSMPQWMSKLDAERTASYADENEALEIPDPIGEPHSVFVELAKEIDQNMSWFITLAGLQPAQI